MAVVAGMEQSEVIDTSLASGRVLSCSEAIRLQIYKALVEEIVKLPTGRSAVYAEAIATESIAKLLAPAIDAASDENEDRVFGIHRRVAKKASEMRTAFEKVELRDVGDPQDALFFVAVGTVGTNVDPITDSGARHFAFAGRPVFMAKADTDKIARLVSLPQCPQRPERLLRVRGRVRLKPGTFTTTDRNFSQHAGHKLEIVELREVTSTLEPCYR